MPIEIVVDTTSGAAEGVGHGVLSLPEMKEAAARAWNDPGFRGAATLWDLRDASVTLSRDELREFAEFSKSESKLRAPGRTAFVIDCNFQFGLVRMFEVFRQQPGIELRIFRRIDEARLWLRTGAGRPRPLRVAVDAETGRATAVGSGALHLEDLQDGALSIGCHPEFRHAEVLWDLRGATIDLTSDEVRSFADVARSVCDPTCPARVGFVVDHDLAYGLIRMFAVFREQPGLDLRVFRDYDEGQRFLNGEAP